MKTVFRITAVLNMLLIVSACVCVVVAAINQNAGLFVVSALAVLVSIFPTALMLVLCDEFKEDK